MFVFKWFRKFCGGTWYRNRYIFDGGRCVIFCWERTAKGYTVEKEEYKNFF
jgi:hypothetical protein